MAQAQRVGRLYIAFQFFFTFLLWVPVFYEYQKRVGLSDPQIFEIQSLYYLAFCVFEIPTGLFADRFGYLRSMRAGAALVTVANLLPAFFPSYAGFVAHFISIALARSLISGASSAWAYEWFRAEGQTDAYKQVEGSARAWGLVGKVAGWAAIGFLMEWKLSTPYTLSALGTGVSLWLALKMPEVPAVRGTLASANATATSAEASVAKPRSSFLAELMPVLGMVATSPALLLIIFQGVALFVLTRIAQVNLFQPILLAKEVPASWHGAIMGGISLFEAAGAARPGWVRRYFTDLNAVFVLTIVMAASLAWMGVDGSIGAMGGLALLSFVSGLSFPIQRQLLNDAIPEPRFRATLLSVESIVDRAATAWAASMIAGFALGGRIEAFLQYSALASVALMAVLWGGGVLAASRRRAAPGVLRDSSASAR